jgi:hypothetical protein
VHVQGDQRNPLYAINMIRVHYDGYWREVDMLHPSSICPTFEFMGVDTQQIISIKKRSLTVGDVNLNDTIIFELSRLGSLIELVMSKSDFQLKSSDNLVKNLEYKVAQYRQQIGDFLKCMSIGKGLFGLGIGIYLAAKNTDVIFGNMSQGIVERFVQAVGVMPDRSTIQHLRISQYHTDSPDYQVSAPYFQNNEVLPFMIDAEFIPEQLIANGCKTIASEEVKT